MVNTTTRQRPRIKRHRGGQKGNQNGRKHGFYSSRLTPDEMCRLWNIANLEGVDPEIAALRIKLHSVLESDPGNRRVLLEAAKLLARWYRTKWRLKPTDAKLVKNAVRRAIEDHSAQLRSRSDEDGNGTQLS